MDRATAPPHTDEEIYEVLRRYQGYVEPTFSDAKLRIPLYGIFEKYNRILREL